VFAVFWLFHFFRTYSWKREGRNGNTPLDLSLLIHISMGHMTGQARFLLFLSTTYKSPLLNYRKPMLPATTADCHISKD